MEKAKNERVRLGELPTQLFEEPFSLIQHHATAFVVNHELAGSGTFVRVAGRSGILTARHVWDHVVSTSKDRRVGLQITNDKHEFLLEIDKLTPRLDVLRKTKAFGPDIEFIELPWPAIGAIEARKSFYNLSLRSQQRRKAAKGMFGFVIISGFPAERVSHQLNDKLRTRVLKLFGLGMIVGKDRTRHCGKFDYWEMKVEIKDEKNAPDYRGVSGAGVWRAVLQKKIGADYSTAKLDDFYFAGVAFYQSDVKGGWRFIRSHGPETVYTLVPSLLKQRR